MTATAKPFRTARAVAAAHVDHAGAIRRAIMARAAEDRAPWASLALCRHHLRLARAERPYFARLLQDRAPQGRVMDAAGERRPMPPAIDQADQGPQLVIPGAEQRQDRDNKAKPRKPQHPADDLPLFDLNSRKQGSMF